MPLPQGYLPRQGDVLVLHAVVKYDVTPEDKSEVFVRPIGYYSDCRIPLKNIVGLHCRKWNEGDRVKAGAGGEHAGTVLAVDDDSVWVKFDSGRRDTMDANVLDKIDPVDESFVEPPAPVKPPPAPTSGDIEEIEF